MATTLQQLIERGAHTTTNELATKFSKDLIAGLQTRLCELGLLDPIINGSPTQPFGPVATADGGMGQNTRNAIFEFNRLTGISYNREGDLSLDCLRALVAANVEQVFKIEFDNSPDDDADTRLAKRVLRFMRKKGYWIARSPNARNIVYIEGVNGDGGVNEDRPDEWNDRRLVIRIMPGGKPQLLLNFEATSEPGKVAASKVNPLGIARMAFGQYKSWQEGLHKGKHPALVQCRPVRIHRDKNLDFIRPGDAVFVGIFGINQHSTNSRPLFVGEYSVGCLVGRYYHEHLLFLEAVKQDIRFLLNTKYEFMTTVISGTDLLKEEPA